jgi:hypothetical protein
MTPQLAFAIAIRDWAASVNYPIKQSGSDEKIIIQYCTGDLLSMWSDVEVQHQKDYMANAISRLSVDHDILYDIEYTDIGHGDLAMVVNIKIANRGGAQERYYDLLQLGPKRTPEQFSELNRLKERYGFK